MQRTVVAAAIVIRARVPEYWLEHHSAHRQRTSSTHPAEQSHPFQSNQAYGYPHQILREVLSKRQRIALKYVPTKFNFADIFTKPLGTVRFRDLRAVLVQNLDGIINNSQFLRRTFSVLKDFMPSAFSH